MYDSELTPIVLQAAAKALAKQAHGLEVPAGCHHVDEQLTLRIQGTLEQLEPSAYAPAIPIDWQRLIATLLFRKDVGREAGRNLLNQAVADLLTGGPIADEPYGLQDRVGDVEAVIRQALADEAERRPKKQRAGACTWKGPCSVSISDPDRTPARAIPAMPPQPPRRRKADKATA